MATRMVTRSGAFLTSLVLACALISTSAASGAATLQEDSAIESSDPTFLAQKSSHIFFGRVFAIDMLVDTVNDPDAPFYKTYYLVEVGSSLKGDLSLGQIVRVLQHGGSDGCLANWFEGDGPLTVDHEYLFITRPTRDADALNIFAIGIGNRLITSEAVRNSEVMRWRSAIVEASASGATDNGIPEGIEPRWVVAPTLTSLPSTPTVSEPDGEAEATPTADHCGTRYLVT